MDKIKYIRLENEDGTYSGDIPLAVDAEQVSVGNDTLINELNKKATKEEVAAVASGSPAGVYPTVAALTTADPDHSKIYVVTADGHWYYYNNGIWTDGGIYQAVEISDNIIGYNHFNNDTNNLLNIEINNMNIAYRQGVINTATGLDGNLTSATQICSLDYIKGDLIKIVALNNNYRFRVFKYISDTNEYIDFSSNWLTEILLNSEKGYYKYRIAISTPNYDNIIPTEGSNISINTINENKVVNYESFGSDIKLLFDLSPKIYDGFEYGILNTTTGLPTSSTGTKSIRTNNFINGKIIFINPLSVYKYLLFEYDENSNFISYNSIRMASSLKITNTNNHKYKLVITTYDSQDMSLDNFKDEINITYLDINDISTDLLKSKFDNQILNIGNSGINTLQANSVEHFLITAKLGFNCLKGDMRLTSDNKIIMCHDIGFTFDTNGDITTFKSSDNTPIHNLTYAQCMNLSYSTYKSSVGRNSTVCDLDMFLRICKLTGKIPYITIRNEYVDITIKELLKILDKYNMRYDCIINNYPSYDTAVAVRKYDKNIALAYVLPANQAPTINDVDKCNVLGNCMLCLFLGNQINNDISDILLYANNKNIRVMNAQVTEYNSYLTQVSLGLVGFHITKAFLPYNSKKFNFRVRCSNGTTTMVSMLNNVTYIADITTEANKIIIENIRNANDSNDNFGIPKAWLNLLPCDLTVKNENKSTVESSIENGTIVINVDTSINQSYTISLEI